MHTFFITMLLAAFSLGSSAQEQQLFDFGWTFTQNGKSQCVDLPHDWDIHAAPDPKTGATGTGGGWYPGGRGEYRKTFSTPAAEVVKLHFEGVYQKAEVFINGHKAGQHAYGYTPFTIDITPYLKSGKKQDNEIVVKVNNSEQPNCRWYSGSGIYRHVWLQTMNKLHFSENGIAVSTLESSAQQAKVEVSVRIDNTSDAEQQIDGIDIVFGEGTFAPVRATAGQASAPTFDQQCMLKPGGTIVYDQQFTILQPRLWSPDTPSLYEAKVLLKSRGKVVGEQPVRFGIRTFSFDAQRGFVLNGKPMLINGACVHHDDGILGAMAFDAAEIRKVKQMKTAGFNLIRTSHNPSTRAFLDACDSIGIMVIDEAFDGWRSSKTSHDYSTLIDSCYRDDIHAMVGRDRNHPCIIAWSIGNEVIERKDIGVITTARKLKEAVMEMDSTRPVTEALCSWDNDWEIYDPHAEVLDIVGYNYMIHKHQGDHQRDPQRIIWQTESYPRDAFSNWAAVHDYPYIVGDIVWTGLDYLGEAGIGRYYYKGEREGEHYVSGGQPDWHGAYCGDVDLTGWRKPISHYREMLWSDDDILYMAVREPSGYYGEIRETQWSVWPTWESWNWSGSPLPSGLTTPDWEGRPIEVEVYTKSPEVSLYLNDHLMGKKEVSRATAFKATFTIPYQAGTLRAVAGDKSTTLTTTGQPARIRLTPDRDIISADGQDLAFITLEVVDREGRVVPDAILPCDITVSGQGRLVAAASADLKDTEPTTSPHVNIWKGRALVAVRSNQKKGAITIGVKSALPSTPLKIKVGK